MVLHQPFSIQGEHSKLAWWKESEGDSGWYFFCLEVGTNGLPQGSVVGPLLFPISINNLDDSVVKVMSKFAD